jgi:hypothetical protein
MFASVSVSVPDGYKKSEGVKDVWRMKDEEPTSMRECAMLDAR